MSPFCKTKVTILCKNSCCSELKSYFDKYSLNNFVTTSELKSIFQEMKKGTYEILCITSCPTGIAHTYMAAEALEKAGQETNHKIKVETKGQ